MRSRCSQQQRVQCSAQSAVRRTSAGDSRSITGSARDMTSGLLTYSPHLATSLAQTPWYTPGGDGGEDQRVEECAAVVWCVCAQGGEWSKRLCDCQNEWRRCARLIAPRSSMCPARV